MSAANTEALTPAQQNICTRIYPMLEPLFLEARRRHPGVDPDELWSAGNFAVVKAAKGYRPEDGPIEPYGFKTIRGELSSAARKWLKIRARELLGADATEFDEREDQSAEERLDAALSSSVAQEQADTLELLKLQAAALIIDDLLHEDPSTLDDEDEERRHARSVAALRRAARSLPEPGPTFFRLRYQEAKTLIEVAQTMNLHLSSVRRLGVRVVKELKKALMGAGEA
ncbi:MAG: sigma-70 family RNA polymerase sigma factor [Polyangiaceae bacterium]|nr:sigma-70 family RNA polymerase sigma factor [Polyangiaceae bacterium]